MERSIERLTTEKWKKELREKRLLQLNKSG